jgi:hypothetical protein
MKMTPSNYIRPPQAPFEDLPQGDGGQVQIRPPEVDIAFWLVIASFALGVVGFLLEGMQNLVVSTLVLALLVGFSFAIRYGQNWARIALAILYALGLPGLLLAPKIIAQGGWASFVIFCLQAALQGATIWLVFRKPGSLWFRKVKSRDA